MNKIGFLNAAEGGRGKNSGLTQCSEKFNKCWKNCASSTIPENNFEYL